MTDLVTRLGALRRELDALHRELGELEGQLTFIVRLTYVLAVLLSVIAVKVLVFIPWSW